MKTINKRIYRGIKKNFSFYICSILLTCIAVLLFLAELFAGSTVDKNYIEFMERNHIEDAEFSTMLPLSEDDIEELSAKYNVTIEPQEYIDCDESGHTLRVFKGSEKVNTYEVISGSDISSDNQILISKGYIEANNYSTGDTIIINNIEFEIAGLVERPDYLYMLKSTSDIYRSNSEFGLAVVSDIALENIGKTAGYYSVIYNDDSKENINAFRKQLYNDFVTVSYVSGNNNPRITKPTEVRDTCTGAGYGIMAVMSVLVISVVSLILSRIVRNDSKQIGTLAAFGMKAGEIKSHYMFYGLIPGFIGSVIGIILSLALAEPLVKYSISNIEYMEGDITADIFPIILSIIIPTILYSLTAVITSGRQLRKYTTVELLSGKTKGSRKHRIMVMTDSDKPIKKKFRVRTIFISKKRTLTAVLGMFFGCLFILFGFNMTDSVNSSFEHGFDDMGEYNYQYILSELCSGTPKGDAEAMVISVFEAADSGQNINFYGVEDKTSLVNVKVDNGNFSGDKYYITSIASVVYNIKEGDTVEIYNPMSLEYENIEISGTITNDVVTGIFTGRENLCSFIGIEDKSTYNAIVSRDILEYDEELAVSNIIEKSALADQLEEASSALNVLLYIFFVIGIIVCVVFVYICVNQIVRENLLNISMFKVLGYRNREINSMVLNAYNVFVPLVFLAAIPASLAVTQNMLDDYAALYHFQGHSQIEIISGIIAAVIFAVSYVISLIILRRKVFNADMVEVMKDNRD